MALIECPDCHTEVSDRAPACPRCGAPVDTPPAVVEDERHRAFEARIAALSQQGYRIVSRADTTAQLVRPKAFSFIGMVAWLLVCGIGGLLFSLTFWLIVYVIGLLLYLFWYAARRDDVTYVVLEDAGADLPTSTVGGFCRACRRWIAGGTGRCPHCQTNLPLGVT